MLAHEIGHYFACRYYRVDATLPFFIPFPSLVGTLGAFIRIKSPIPPPPRPLRRRDRGSAGGLRGGAARARPRLLRGLLSFPSAAFDPARRADARRPPPASRGWRASSSGPPPEGSTLAIGGLGLAGWFGLFLTGLNLLPIGQLDGGHVVYALLRERAAIVSRLGFWACVALVYFGPSWLVWALLLLFVGRRHPPTLDDDEPLGRGRIWSRSSASWSSWCASCRTPFPTPGSSSGPPSHHADRVDVDGDARPAALAEAVDERRAHRLAHGRALALEQDLEAVLAAQAGQRREGGPEHAEAAGRASRAAAGQRLGVALAPRAASSPAARR